MTVGAIKELRFNVTKVDAITRRVYGEMASSVEDKTGESLDYFGSKSYFEKWSAEIYAGSEGKSYGNVREMHTKSAVGILCEPLEFDDAAEIIRCVCEVVDEGAWEKVDKGVYTGFSIGGRYIKQYTDAQGRKRYIIAPFEVSLVDNPAIPGCHFVVMKADGSVEERSFAEYASVTEGPEMTQQDLTPTVPNDQVVARAQELAKAAGAAGFADYVEAARLELETAAKAAGTNPENLNPAPAAAEAVTEAPVGGAVSDEGGEKAAAAATDMSDVRNLVVQKWVAPDGTPFDKKADAVAHVEKGMSPIDRLNASLTAAESAIQSTVTKAAAPAPVEKSPVAKAVTKTVRPDKTATLVEKSAFVEKGMYSIAYLVDLICQLNYMAEDARWEARFEGDGSTLGDQMKAAVATLVGILKQMVEEETSELFEDEDGSMLGDDDLEVVIERFVQGRPKSVQNVVKFMGGEEATAALKAVGAIVEKAGARHSKADLDKLQAVHDHSVDLGAKCMKDDGGEGTTDKAAVGDVSKAMGDRIASLEQENGQLVGLVERAVSAVTTLTEKVNAMEAAPAPRARASKLHVVEKGDDDPTARQTAALEVLKTMDPNTIATAAVALSQRNGFRPYGAIPRG